MHANGDARSHLYPDEALTIGFVCELRQRVEELNLRLELHHKGGALLFAVNSRDIGVRLPPCAPGEHNYKFHLGRLNLLKGYYQVSIGIGTKDEPTSFDWHEKRYEFEVKNPNATSGIVHIPVHVTAEHETFVLGAAF